MAGPAAANNPEEASGEQAARHRVIIAAAVAAMFGENARILAIYAADKGSPAEWTRHGRASLQNSHTLEWALAARSLAGHDPGAIKR